MFTRSVTSQIQQVENGRAAATEGDESTAHEMGSNIHGSPMTKNSFSWM